MRVSGLPKVGSADSPTPCLGDVRFTEARYAREIAECQAICAGCPWRDDCHQLATALTEAGERVSGIWAGVHYGIDHETKAHEQTNDHDRHDHWGVEGYPARVVWLVRDEGVDAHRELPQGAIPIQRNRESR